MVRPTAIVVFDLDGMANVANDVNGKTVVVIVVVIVHLVSML